MPENDPMDSRSIEAQANRMPADDIKPRRRSHPILRLGCGALLAGWFIALLLPCALFYLAANGEIRFWHRDIPLPHSHPLLLISLVSAANSRGLRIENAFAVDSGADETSRCIQTLVRFVLWESNEDGRQDVSYCDCYRRVDAAAAWQLDSTFSGACLPAEQDAPE